MPITGLFYSDGGIAAVNRLTLYAVTREGYHVDVLTLGKQDSSVDLRYIPRGTVTYRAFAGDKLAF